MYDGKRDKIQRNTLIGTYEEGEYRMIDIESQNKAIKIAWIPIDLWKSKEHGESMSSTNCQCGTLDTSN